MPANQAPSPALRWQANHPDGASTYSLKAREILVEVPQDKNVQSNSKIWIERNGY
jgi:hypothetical protein